MAERMVQRRASMASRRASLPALVPTSDRGLKQRMSLGDSERRASVELSPTKRWRNEFDQVRRLAFAFNLTIAEAMPVVRQFHEADVTRRELVDKDGFEKILMHVAGYGPRSTSAPKKAAVVDVDREWEALMAAAAASEHLNQNVPTNPVERFCFAATLESVFAWYVGSHFHCQKRDSVRTPPTEASTPRTTVSEPLSPISPGPTTPTGSPWSMPSPLLPPIASRGSLMY